MQKVVQLQSGANMIFYEICKNFYVTMFFLLLFRSRQKDGTPIPYNILLVVSGFFSILLIPVGILLSILTIIKNTLEDKNLEEYTEGSIWESIIDLGLSEVEWRYPETVYLYMCEESEIDQDGETIFPLKIEDVYSTLITRKNIFCEARQETEEEYINRCSEHLLKDPEKTEEEQATYNEQYGVEIRETLRKQFKIIIKKGNGKTLREFYLGREFLFRGVPPEEPEEDKEEEFNLAPSH
jgi:hypothetical protein